MLNIAVIVGGNQPIKADGFDYYVGVDRACLWLIENGYALDWAIGDFDSVTEAELAVIKKVAKQFDRFPAAKDDTDTELAIKRVFATFPNAQVTVFGAFGGRMDHFLTTLFMPSDPEIAPFMKHLCLVDDQNVIQYLPSGEHQISPVADKDYISFMVEGDGLLTIHGAQYPLDEHHRFSKKVYVSNTFKIGRAHV